MNYHSHIISGYQAGDLGTDIEQLLRGIEHLYKRIEELERENNALKEQLEEL